MPRPEWEALLNEMLRRADAASRLPFVHMMVEYGTREQKDVRRTA